MSDAFYLKYRPQKVSQLDLKDIRNQLIRVLSSGKIPHAFLFAGPKGLGKTSAARIVAKAVNCERRKTKKDFEPCNKCENCKSITVGTALDLIEIDAASNRGIDDIRNLKEKIRLSPATMKKKVYVIDEVHMLTTEAFNALLKTLEEPPKHVLFILCTTEAHKLPETIKSRCLLFNFKKATTEELIRSLKRVVRGEDLKIADEVLKKVVNVADGSFRDATKVLEQLSFKSRVIKEVDFDELFKETNFWGPEFFQLLENKEAKKLLGVIDNLVKNGGDLKSFTFWILSVLRAMLLSKFGIEIETDGLKIDRQNLLRYNFELEDVKRLIFIFDQASRELKMAAIPRLSLELAITKWCQDKMENGKWKMENGKNIKKDLNASLGQHKINSTKMLMVKIEDIKKKWQEFLNKIKSKNHSIEALLKASAPMKIEANRLMVEVFYEFHKGRLENEPCLQLVEQTLQELFVYPIKVRYVLGKKRDIAFISEGKNKRSEFISEGKKEGSDFIKKENNDASLTTDDQLVKTAEEIFIKNNKNN